MLDSQFIGFGLILGCVTYSPYYALEIDHGKFAKSTHDGTHEARS
jgi:hypothetical protein